MKNRMLARRRQTVRKTVLFALLLTALALDTALLTTIFRQAASPWTDSQLVVDPLPALCFQPW